MNDKFKVGQTYACDKCKSIIHPFSIDEYNSMIYNHSKKCPGYFKEVKGECIKVAFELSRDNGWMFCFGKVKNEKGEEFIHAWNESEGYIIEKEGKLSIETKNITGKITSTFVFDFSNSSRIISEPGVYYLREGMIIDTIKKFNYKELLKRMKKAEAKTGDVFSWIR